MRRVLTALLYVVLLAVVLSTVQTIWVVLADKERYTRIFPEAQGPLYWITVTASGLAGLNAILIAFRRRWAVWLNPIIGLSSIGLLRMVGSPLMNQVIVLLASTVSTLLPWYLWLTGDRERQAVAR